MEQLFSILDPQATRSSQEPMQVSALPGEATSAPGESSLAQVLLISLCLLEFGDMHFDASKLSGKR